MPRARRQAPRPRGSASIYEISESRSAFTVRIRPVSYNGKVTTSTVPRHLSLAPCASDAQPEALARAELPQQPRLGLPQLDQLALTSFVTGDAAELVEHARGLAESLAGADGDGTRRRTIARNLALVRTEMDLVDAAVGAAMGRGDFKAMEVLSKVAERLSRRMCALLDEHRRELGRDGPKAVMLIGAAQVNVQGGR
jgi:hypothetical protein